jgi:hypothetical protein
MATLALAVSGALALVVVVVTWVMLEKMFDCTREKILDLDGGRSCDAGSLLVIDECTESMLLGSCPVSRPCPFFRGDT